MQLVNLTPHPFNLVDSNGDIVLSLDGADNPPRVDVQDSFDQTIQVDGNDVDVFQNSYGDVQNLPDPQDGVLYIVSRMVVNACPDRDDLVIPNDLVRDDDGNIVGCQNLSWG